MSTPTPQGLHAALAEAIEDEYRARAHYLKSVQAFGAIAPFNLILASEEAHIASLSGLFRKYRLPQPVDSWYGRIPFPSSLLDACRTCAAGEIANIAMVDRLLDLVGQLPDVRQVFLNLQTASRDYHLPALRACIPRLSAAASPAADGTVTAAILGAVIGGANALGWDLHRVRNNEITMRQALGDSLMRGAATSLATTAAAALTARLEERHLMRLPPLPLQPSDSPT
jgi:hypothetical protein